MGIFDEASRIISYSNPINNITPNLSKALLVFYLLVANSYTRDLYSGQLSQYIQNNRMAQHFVGYLTMILIMTNFVGVNDVKTAVIYSSITYLFFIITTKLDLFWNLSVLFILIFAYLYETQIDNKEKKLSKDEAVTKKDIKKIKKNNNKIKKIIFASIFTVSIIGFIFYFSRKKKQYGGEFDIDKFIFEKGRKHTGLKY